MNTNNMLAEPQFLLSLVIGLMVGAASGLLGAFMVLKRMALVGDALTHVALPGIGLALLFGINPFIGAFALLFGAMFLIWKLERYTDLPIETLVGIFFAASLAIGILITPELELYEALFGDIYKINLLDGIIAFVSAAAVFTIMSKISNKMIMGIMSEDLAISSGIKVRKLNFIFFFLVAVIVALGVKIVGTLLMGALVIVPAAAAKNISGSFKEYILWSSFLGLISAGIGIYFSKILFLPPGPAVVLASAAFFLISLVLKRR
jgi:ABC-type Mn2+/Zn2+ transport system permease subunit